MKKKLELIVKIRIKLKFLKNINYVSLHGMFQIKIESTWK